MNAATTTSTTPAPAVKPLPSIPDYGENAIEITNLTFSYRATDSSSSYTNTSTNNPENVVLQDMNLSLPTGSRCLLIGANGSGKSTLLRILAGRHLTKSAQVHVTINESDGTQTQTMIPSKTSVLGLHSFHDTRLNFHRAYLDCDWGMRTVAFVGGAVPFMADIPVHQMMEKLQSSYPERRQELIDLLGIDLHWRMHQLSDGQRRRVQLFLGLIRPFKVLLLDEVTTSLDVCVRQDLLRWLVRESNERRATVIYATHIFDGLDDWASHLYYLNDTGSCGWQGKMDELEIYHTLKEQHHPCKMLAIAEHWLRAELEEKRKQQKYEKAQGTMAHQVDLFDRTQGGYASGRMETDDEVKARLKRHGRLSDIMGNSGVLEKVHRTAGK